MTANYRFHSLLLQWMSTRFSCDVTIWCCSNHTGGGILYSTDRILTGKPLFQLHALTVGLRGVDTYSMHISNILIFFKSIYMTAFILDRQQGEAVSHPRVMTGTVGSLNNTLDALRHQAVPLNPYNERQAIIEEAWQPPSFSYHSLYSVFIIILGSLFAVRCYLNTAVHTRSHYTFR